MPVNIPVAGGMHPGKMIRISGQPSYNPSRFGRIHHAVIYFHYQQL